MLVIRRDGELELLTQTDHAALAGALAQRWGGGDFALPPAHASLVCAAVHHDDGWYELDGRPAFNAEAATAGAFHRDSADREHRALRARCGIGLCARSPRRRAVQHALERILDQSLGSGRKPPAGDPLAQEVVAAQEARWMPALREVWGNRGRRSEFDAHTWHAYEVLQAVDLLSLGLGLMNADSATDGSEPLAVETSLSSIDQSARRAPSAVFPLAAGGSVVTLTLTRPRWRSSLSRSLPADRSGPLELHIPVRQDSPIAIMTRLRRRPLSTGPLRQQRVAVWLAPPPR